MYGSPWTPEQIALLGTDTDKAIGARLGRSKQTVANKRLALKIAPFNNRVTQAKRGGWGAAVEGRRFHRLTVAMELTRRGLRGQRVVVVRCDCGETFTVDLPLLRKGNTKSCGCLQRERAAKIAAKTGRANKKGKP